MAYWHSVCPVCEEGRLFVTKIEDSGDLFLLCEECESAWSRPEEIDPDVNFDFKGLKVQRAGHTDIEGAGWSHYPLNETA